MFGKLSANELTELQRRLQNAAALATQALKGAKEENPLYEPTRKLLVAHQEIRDLLVEEPVEASSERSEDECEVVHAAIEIGREEHTLKADAKDIIKAFFMWKDDPQERAKQRSA